MQRGRPRTTRKDLPPGLYQDVWGTYFYRATRPGKRTYQLIGKVDREAAIKAWVGLTTVKHDDAPGGTVAELIERFLRDLDDVAATTRVNYEFHCGKLLDRWGARKYAVTADEAARGGALRALDIATYLRDARKAGRGAISANYAIGVLSIVFARARENGMTEYNPCFGVRRNPHKPFRTLPTVEQMDAAEATAITQGRTRLRLMIGLARRTGMRQTDIRQLQVQQIVGDELKVRQSKTGMEQEFVISAAVRAILDEAATLPGRSRSMFVFPLKNGQPMSAAGFQTEWRKLKAGFQFRTIRKWAINQKIKAGENATDFAGHFDPKTTRLHYDVTPKKVTPL